MFGKIIRKFRNKKAVYILYSKIVEQARKPEFYTEYGVDDTLDGRFDMVLLHLFLVIYRLEENGDEEKLFQRQLQEAFITDMDRSLREMGVGDMSVGKQVKKMSVSWFGRAGAYRESLCANDDNGLLEETLKRNIYGQKDGAAVKQMANYVRQSVLNLHEQKIEDVKKVPAFASPQKEI